MRFQQKTYSCGAAAIHNSLRCYGVNVSEKRIRSVAGTNKEQGTSPAGIMSALDHLGFSSEVWEDDKKVKSWEWLTEQLRQGHPVILCFQNWQHYVTAIGMVGERVLIFDSARTKKSLKENGVWMLNRNGLLRKWYHTQEGLLSGYAVLKKK